MFSVAVLARVLSNKHTKKDLTIDDPTPSFYDKS